jgi:hypothetical protein
MPVTSDFFENNTVNFNVSTDRVTGSKVLILEHNADGK